MGGTITHQASTAIEQAARRAAFMHWYGVLSCSRSNSPAKPRSGESLRMQDIDMLVVLYEHRDNHLTATHLATLLVTDINSVKARISRLRKAMETEAIDRDEDGYWLTEIGIAEARDAMMAMARSLAA